MGKLSRPSIPEAIKREVRQRCGFGCVICGMPIYEYEHMLEYARVKRHVANEITLLCPNHHSEKTKGLLTSAEVENANNWPKNIRKGHSKPYDLRYWGDKCLMRLGNNVFTAPKNEGQFDLPSGSKMSVVALMIDAFPIVGFNFENDQLLLTINLFDEKGNSVLTIKDNEMIYIVDHWDVDFVGKQLTVRRGYRDIILEIEFNVPNEIKINRGDFFYNGRRVEIQRNGFLIIDTNGLGFVGGSGPIGLSVGERPTTFDLPPVGYSVG